MTREDEALVEARLNVRRGLPVQDLSGRRGLPDDGKGGAAHQLSSDDADSSPPQEASNIVRRPGPRANAPGAKAGAPAWENVQAVPAGKERARGLASS